jgi:hypothetical protein
LLVLRLLLHLAGIWPVDALDRCASRSAVARYALPVASVNVLLGHLPATRSRTALKVIIQAALFVVGIAVLAFMSILIRALVRH